MRRRPLLMLGAAGACGLFGAANRGSAFAQSGQWIAADVNTMQYRVLLPDGYDPVRHYPVVLYLHQLDMGTYPEALLRQVNPWFESAGFRSGHKCIVVMPMLDQTDDKEGRLLNFGGKRQGHAGADNTIAALKQVIARYSVDPARIYVTGNSMGGMGTWEMLLSYNALTGTKEHIFAAGLPLAGTHRTADPAAAARRLRQVPVWSIHGANDEVVPLDWDRTMARLMRGSSSYRYTEDPALGHEVWDRYYTLPAVWDWLFAQAAPGT
jgi:predicted peptidase